MPHLGAKRISNERVSTTKLTTKQLSWWRRPHSGCQTARWRRPHSECQTARWRRPHSECQTARWRRPHSECQTARWRRASDIITYFISLIPTRPNTAIFVLLHKLIEMNLMLLWLEANAIHYEVTACRLGSRGQSCACRSDRVAGVLASSCRSPSESLESVSTH